MPVLSSASETPIETRCRLARRVAMLAALLIAACGAGCDRCRPNPQPARDGRAAALDGADLDSASALDAVPVTDDAADGPDSGAAGDAGPVVRDAGPVVRDARTDAAAAVCPPWRLQPAAGHGWLHARVLSSSGVPLTSSMNHVDIFVRRAMDPLPGERADPNEPCAVASYDQTASKVRVLAAAVGFSSQEREFSPQRCTEATPCSVELPQSLEARYYRTTAGLVSVRVASDVLQAERPSFAAAVARDALARSKALRRPLGDELERAGKATGVPALDLAIHYTESRLRKRCTAICLGEPALDRDVRIYLKNVRRPAQQDPFELRTAPERWRRLP